MAESMHMHTDAFCFFLFLSSTSTSTFYVIIGFLEWLDFTWERHMIYMNAHRDLLWILVNFWGPCLWVVTPSMPRQWFDTFFKSLRSGFLKLSWHSVCVPKEDVSLDTEPSPLSLWLFPFLTCHIQCFMRVDLGSLWMKGHRQHQHKRHDPGRVGRVLGWDVVSREYIVSIWVFSTVAIYSSFHANGIIWSMNALGKGKRGIKSVNAYSYKWVGRFTTFSPESNLSAIRTGYKTGRSKLWLNYT